MTSGYIFPILNSNGTKSTTVVDFDVMFARKELWLDSGLFTWGNNSDGLLGNNNIAYYSSPVQIGSLTNWKQVSIGTHSSAIKTDGTLWTWGSNRNGGLGNNNTVDYSSPIQVGSLTDWKQVSIGMLWASGAIKTDGTLWTWGYNHEGELGNNNTVDYSSPIQVGSLTDWKYISCGYFNVGSIKTDGSLWVWGYNPYGQLGLGTSGVANISSPVQVGSLTSWKQVSLGKHTMAIKYDGSLWTCGYNLFGGLGINNIVNYSSPVQVGSLTNWKQVFAGFESTAAIKTDGTLWAWGRNDFGQLGNNNIVSYSSPVQIGSLTNWKQVSLGNLHTAAIKTDGTLWAWGFNRDGGLGNNNRTYYSSPVQIGSLTNWKQVATSAGNFYTAAISSPDLP